MTEAAAPSSCAPFRVVASKARRPEFPTLDACRALAASQTHSDCCCRAYPNRGFYVMGSCGHAHSWCLRREFAEEACSRETQWAARAAPAATALSAGGRPVIDGTTEECFLCGKDHRVDAVCPPMARPPAGEGGR